MFKETPASEPEFLYEGKVKKIYRLGESKVLQVFKDTASAFNGVKLEEVSGKGEFNAQFSAWIFEFLHSAGVKTHFIRYEAPCSLVTQELKMFPVELVVRNQAAGSLCKRLGVQEGVFLSPPVLEWFLKDDAKGDPLLSEDLVLSLYRVPLEAVAEMRRTALLVNSVLSERFKQAGLVLVDFKLEFGKSVTGEILLGDEFSPDSCRVWESTSGEKLDKDRFRFDLGDLMEGYQKIWTKLKESEPA